MTMLSIEAPRKTRFRSSGTHSTESRATAEIRIAAHGPLVLVGRAVRLAFILLGPAGLMMTALFLRYAVFEYFHGGEQTLRALWHAFSA